MRCFCISLLYTDVEKIHQIQKSILSYKVSTQWKLYNREVCQALIGTLPMQWGEMKEDLLDGTKLGGVHDWVIQQDCDNQGTGLVISLLSFGCPSELTFSITQTFSKSVFHKQFVSRVFLKHRRISQSVAWYRKETEKQGAQSGDQAFIRSKRSQPVMIQRKRAHPESLSCREGCRVSDGT